VRWLPLLVVLIPFPALAETWTGSPKVIDGDSLVVAGQEMRLHNIDAFEKEQLCTRDGEQYPCGLDATLALIGLIQAREVACEGQIRDRYGRVLAKCRIGDLDLGSAMVRSGWALAAWRAEYRPDEQYAREARLGAWVGTFQRPKEWRKRNHIGH
jgi:endonuclease YncB( thermonuclease family)